MGSRIRILLSIPDLGGGGAEREMAVLLERLSRERFEPHLCLWREIFAYPHPADIPVHMLHKNKPWHLFRTIRRTRNLIDELEPSVVFSQLHYLNMVTGTALAQCRHRPGWVFRQVNDPRVEMRGPFAVWARRALAGADFAAGCSRGVSEAMAHHLRLDRARVRTLTNMVDVARIETLAGEPAPIAKAPYTFTVVHAGRFHKQKNQAMLLDAFSRLKGHNAELWMLGQGPLERSLKARACKLGIERQVKWLGFVDNPYPLFAQADCFALSSIYEGLPNTVIEALLCGTPVVSTRCPFGPEELIEDGVTGLLTPVGDSCAFGAALERLAEDALVVDTRLARERFDTARVCREYEGLFEEAAR